MTIAFSNTFFFFFLLMKGPKCHVFGIFSVYAVDISSIFISEREKLKMSMVLIRKLVIRAAFILGR